MDWLATPPEERERVRRQGSPAAAGAGPAEHPAFVEVEGHQCGLGIALVGLLATAGTALEHRVDALENQQLPEEGRGDQRIGPLGQRAQRQFPQAVLARDRAFVGIDHGLGDPRVVVAGKRGQQGLLALGAAGGQQLDERIDGLGASGERMLSSNQ